MSDQVDHVHLDIDKPIPYKLTELGRRTCQEIRDRQMYDSCQHHWHPNVRVGLVCCKCGEEASVKKWGQRIDNSARGRYER